MDPMLTKCRCSWSQVEEAISILDRSIAETNHLAWPQCHGICYLAEAEAQNTSRLPSKDCGLHFSNMLCCTYRPSTNDCRSEVVGVAANDNSWCWSGGKRHGTWDPSVCQETLPYAHTMVFVGSIWKNKSGWFPIGMSLGLSVATEIVLTAGVNHWFSTQVLLKINPARHHRSNETPPCPYNGVCWIHIEE
jgi:hypothetical protein